MLCEALSAYSREEDELDEAEHRHVLKHLNRWVIGCDDGGVVEGRSELILDAVALERSEVLHPVQAVELPASATLALKADE